MPTVDARVHARANTRTPRTRAWRLAFWNGSIRYMALAISLQGVIFIALIIQGVVARVELNPTGECSVLTPNPQQLNLTGDHECSVWLRAATRARPSAIPPLPIPSSARDQMQPLPHLTRWPRPETRIVEFVESTRNASETRLKAATVAQTVWRQYRLNIRFVRALGELCGRRKGTRAGIGMACDRPAADPSRVGAAGRSSRGGLTSWSSTIRPSLERSTCLLPQNATRRCRPTSVGLRDACVHACCFAALPRCLIVCSRSKPMVPEHVFRESQCVGACACGAGCLPCAPTDGAHVTAHTLTAQSIQTDAHTESTHKGIDALQDRFDDLEVSRPRERGWEGRREGRREAGREGERESERA